MSYPDSLKQQAIQLRRRGYSYAEIAAHLHVPRSSLYYWTSNVVLDQQAQTRIQQRKQRGIERAQLFFKHRRLLQNHEIFSKITPLLNRLPLTPELAQLSCALLFWAEGEKMLNAVCFMNSDPRMICAFLSLLRSGFPIVESKFRILLHLHEYHHEPQMIQYWSNLTHIPASQFSKSYIKPHTQKHIHPHYPGCCSLRYYDAYLARYLTHLYTCFSQKLTPLNPSTSDTIGQHVV